MKLFPQLTLVLFIITMTLFCNQPTTIGYTSEPINTASDPVQELLSENQSFTIQMGNKNFTIKILARYQISARVVSSKFYSSGWESILSPIDLTLVWGDLADLKYDRYISFSQNNRWYFYRYSADCPVSNTYIINHSGNNHLIPSTDNIRRALKTIRANILVKIEGYLVNIRGKDGENVVWWNTSTSRSDTGNHSCEILYVEKIRIQNKVYL